MLDREKIESSASACLVQAGTSFRADQIEAYRRAVSTEENENARWVLEQILENARIAERNRAPLCDDTGIPHVFVEVGDEVGLPPGWMGAIKRGIADGLRRMPGRPMAIRGDDVQRIEQSLGPYEDPAELAPAPLLVREIPGKTLRLTVLLLGGGPEIRAKTLRIFHKRSVDVVLGEAASWMASEAKSLGCTPCVVAMGVGRTHMEASALMLEAMKEGDLRFQSPLEEKVTRTVNQTLVGPLGLGGKTTALGTFLKVGPLRASGVRIVSARPCCCFEPRRATVTID